MVARDVRASGVTGGGEKREGVKGKKKRTKGFSESSNETVISYHG